LLDKLNKEDKIRIIRALRKLKIRPEAHLQRLVGENAYKFRVGDYRLIVDLNKNKLLVLVVKIGHRRNVYNN
jgi:mRNA interferase RelE/StbE